VLAEEVGFVGVVLLMCLFGCLLIHGFTVAYHSRDRMGALIAIGVVTMLAAQIFLNIGMTVGLMPITGLPLPFISYGGTFVVMMMFGMGLVNSVWVHRKEIA
jgi:rod shape determining protein RodA